MAIRPILKMGDPRLLQVSQPVTEFGTPELEALIADMFETMLAADGAGLAAPQIGVPLRLVIFGFEQNQRYPQALSIPQTVLINPVIRPLTAEVDANWEGCLSVPDWRGVVPRWAKLHYEGFDQFGNRVSREADGFHARVVQHECDHLDGILYPMRMQDMSQLSYIEELNINFPEE